MAGQEIHSKGPGGSSSIVLNESTVVIVSSGATTLNGSPIATDASVATAIANLVASSPAALDTLDELAAALGDDANFATTVTNALAGKSPIAGSSSIVTVGTVTAGVWNGTDIAIADGGTGASTAADARTNLGLGTLATQNGTFSGTSSGTNTGDQDLSAFAEPSAANVGSYHLLQGQLNPLRWQHFAWLPQVSTTINYWGGGNNPTVLGTLSHSALAITNYRTSRNRSVVTGSAVAANVAQLIENNPVCYRGDAAGRGGFFFCAVFGIETSVALSIGMWGLALAQPTLPATDLLANTDFIALGYASTDGNMQISHNDSTGTATSVDLGASFPARTANSVFRLFLFAAPNGSEVKYQVDRLDSAASTSGTLSTNLPANTVLLKRILRESNNVTAAACIVNMYSSHLWVKY